MEFGERNDERRQVVLEALGSGLSMGCHGLWEGGVFGRRDGVRWSLGWCFRDVMGVWNDGIFDEMS